MKHDQIIGPGPTGGYLNTVDRNKKKKIKPSKLPDTDKAEKRMKEMRLSKEKNLNVKKINKDMENFEIAIEPKSCLSKIDIMYKDLEKLKNQVNEIERTIRNYGIYR